MTAIRLIFRRWLRQRWRTGLGLALLLGLVGGVALTAAAGARRTDTAYPRLLRWSDAANVQVIPGCVGLGGFYAALARLPQVASMSTEVVYELAVPGRGGAPAGQLEALASPDGTLGVTTDRVRILAGQRPRAPGPADVMIDPQLATGQRLRPGSTLHLIGVASTAKACPPQRVGSAAGRPAPLTFRVSAVAAFDDQVVPAPGLGGAPRVLLSPGFWRTGAGRRFGPGDAANVRLRPGAPSLPSVPRPRTGPALPVRWRAQLREPGPAAGGGAAGHPPGGGRPGRVCRAGRLLALVVLCPLIGRQLILDAVEFPTLRALGMTRARLLGVSLARAAAVTCGGACSR